MADYSETVETVFTQRGTSDVNRGYDQMSSGAGKYGQAWAKVQAGLEAGAPYIREWGSRMAEASKEWAGAYKNASLIEGRLEGMAKSRGIPPEAIESIKKMSNELMKTTGLKQTEIQQAALAMFNFGMSSEEVERVLPLLARQSITLGTSIEGLGMAMGKAYGSGNLGALKRMGVTVDDQTFAIWKATSGQVNWNNAAQVGALRSLVLEGAMKGIDQTAVALDSNMHSAGGKSMIWAARQEAVHEVLGQGAQKVYSYVNTLKKLGIAYMEAHPEQTRFAGGFAAIFGQGTKLIGQIGTMAHSYNEIRRTMQLVSNTANAAAGAKKGLATATEMDSLAEKEKTVVANAEAGALLRSGQAAAMAGRMKVGAGGLPGGAAAAGGGGLLGLLGMPAGAAIAASPAASLALMAGTAYGGWQLGSWIARSANIGGAGDLARAQKAQRELEAEVGSKVGEEDAGFTERWKAARKRYLTGGGLQGTAERTGNGELVIRVQGGAGVSADEMEDYADMM